MSDKVNEQLSALVDDELPGVERRLLLERMSRDPGLRGRWERYHLISDAIHDRVVTVPDEGFADRVMASLEDEPALQTGPGRGPGWQRVLKPVAGLAVAASVAVVALMTVQSINRPAEQAPTLAVAPPQQLVPGANPDVQLAAGQWRRQAPGVEARLSGYLVNHNEYAVSSGVQGVLPYVRIVGYDRENP